VVLPSVGKTGPVGPDLPKREGAVPLDVARNRAAGKAVDRYHDVARRALVSHSKLLVSKVCTLLRPATQK
jgi:hypothetical protein